MECTRTKWVYNKHANIIRRTISSSWSIYNCFEPASFHNCKVFSFKFEDKFIKFNGSLVFRIVSDACVFVHVRFYRRSVGRGLNLRMNDASVQSGQNTSDKVPYTTNTSLKTGNWKLHLKSWNLSESSSAFITLRWFQRTHIEIPTTVLSVGCVFSRWMLHWWRVNDSTARELYPCNIH